MRDSRYDHVERDRALFRSRKLDQTITECRAALGSDPDHAAAHYLLGQCLQLQERWSEAEAEYHKLLHLNPEFKRRSE